MKYEPRASRSAGKSTILAFLVLALLAGYIPSPVQAAVGDVTTYFFKDLPLNHPTTNYNPTWNPAGQGTQQFQYSQISPIGMPADLNSSNGSVTYRTPKDGYVEVRIYVPEYGRYSLDLLVHKNIGGGIADISVDGSVVGQFDFYASPAPASIASAFAAPVTLVLSKGHHVLKLQPKSKSAGSYYYVYPHSLKLQLLEALPIMSSKLTPDSVKFDRKPSEQANVTVTMTTYDNTLLDISYDGGSLRPGTDYSVTGESVTIDKSFLSTLPIGKAELTFNFNDGIDPVLSVHVSDSLLPPSAASITPTYAVYEKTGANQNGLTVTLDVYNTSLAVIKKGSATLTPGTDYTLAGNTISLHPSYLSSLPLGTSTLTFLFGGGQAPTLDITVNDSRPVPVNMTFNPGFEEDQDHNGLPDRWSFGKSGTGTWQWDETVKRSGSKSVKLTNVAAGDRAYFYQQYLTVKPGGTYDFSAYYRTENMLGQPFIQLTWYTANYGFIAAKPLNADKSAPDWQQVIQRQTAPPNAAFAYISVQLNSNTGNVWFDDVSFTQILTDSFVAPTTAVFDQNPAAQADVPVAIAGNGNELIEIRNDAYVLKPNADYSHAGNTVTLSKTYLSQLQTGSTLLTFDFSVGADRNFALQIINSFGLNVSNATFNKKGGDAPNISVAITAGLALQKIRNGSAVMNEGTDYIATGNTVTISAGYLASLPTRSHPIYFELAGGQTYSMIITVIDTTTPQSVNLLANPDFEEGSGTPSSWTIAAGSVEWDGTVAKNGSKSIKLSTSSASQSSVVSQTYISIIPGSAYQFESFYLSEGVQGKVRMIVDWYSSPTASGYLSRATAEGLGGTADWRKLFHEQIAPAEAAFAKVTFQLAEGTGTAWFDQARLVNNNMLRNPGFEAGDTVPDSWTIVPSATSTALLESGSRYAGQRSVKLETSTSGDSVTLKHPPVAVTGEKLYNVQTHYKLQGAGTVVMELAWLDAQGAILRRDELIGSQTANWSLLTTRQWAPKKAIVLNLQLSLRGGPSMVMLDEAEVRQELIDSSGGLIPVTDLEDVTEPLAPADFWSRMPVNPLQPPTDSVWTQSAIRNFFFGPTESEGRANFSFGIPAATITRDNGVPVVNNALGTPVQPNAPLIMAGDIPFRPFMIAHAGYSNKYYPRRMHEYLFTQYNLSYALTGDERFKSRAEELIGFLQYSQWQEDGSNAFTSAYYPNEYTLHPEWAGGWDYLFDWRWTDGYGYTWSLHEPDHHVNSQIASALVNSYEMYGNEQYLQMAKQFVYNQIPRYGFHKGVWKNNTYYWTEYNPTGAAAGNTTSDATDNVTALVAGAAAKIGYYETDPVLKAQILEFARGLMWNLVREFETDGRWFYDGQENPLNPGRFYISHDSAVLLPVYAGLPYLYKAGADVSDLMDFFSELEQKYATIWGLYQRKEHLKLAKIYDGNPAPNENLTFSTFALVTGDDLRYAKFQDFISDSFIVPATLDVRITKLLPPARGKPDWTMDPVDDVVLRATPQQLAEGIAIPFALTKGSAYKMSYEVRTKSDFDRNTAVNRDSVVMGWQVDDSNEATFVKLTSGTSGDATRAHTLPLSLQSNLNSTNFMSFGARIAFPFSDEVSALLVPSPAPNAIVYKDVDDWKHIRADRYIYPIQSLMPIRSGASLGNENYGAKGKSFGTKEGDFVELEFEAVRPSAKYTVSAHYSKGRTRGKAQLSIDGIPLGPEYDLYMNTTTQQDVPEPVLADMGIQKLKAGKHTLRYTITGKNTASSGYQIGLYEALVLTPTTD